MTRAGVIPALQATGHAVVDLGLVSTPVIQHTIRRLDAAGGISIGASHNTADWNALKFFGARGTYLSTAEAGELLDIYHLHNFDFVPWNKTGALRRLDGAIDGYLDGLAAVYDLEAIKGLKVLVDCSNGTSSLLLRRMNERFGFNFILINARLQGAVFAHEPPMRAFFSTWIRTGWRWPPKRGRRFPRSWRSRCLPTGCCPAFLGASSSPTFPARHCSRKSPGGTGQR
jgi:phosphomannomutase